MNSLLKSTYESYYLQIIMILFYFVKDPLLKVKIISIIYFGNIVRPPL